MYRIFEGISIDRSDEQLEKVCTSITFMFDDNVTEVKEVDIANAEGPTAVTEEGIIIDCNEVH